LTTIRARYKHTKKARIRKNRSHKEARIGRIGSYKKRIGLRTVIEQ
jgi:hypothetical protein